MQGTLCTRLGSKCSFIPLLSRLVTWTLLYARQLGNTVKCASEEKTETEEQAGLPPTTRCLKLPGVL